MLAPTKNKYHMNTRICMYILLLATVISCKEKNSYESESFGDMTIIGQKMVDIVLTPDKINGSLYITSKPNDQIVTLSGTSNYENLIGLSHTKVITGNLQIINNDELSDLSPLDSLRIVDKSIMIKDNPNISKLDFISNLKVINGIELRRIRISDLDFISKIKNINGWLGLHELEYLKGFGNLKIESVKGLFLDSLVHMENTDFLSNLREITDAIYLTENPNLRRVNLKVENTKLNSHLNISSNKLLTQIIGLEEIQTINKELIIIGNESLTNLDFLKGLTQVNGSIMIRGNPNLIDFSGLANIQHVKGSVQIEDNGAVDNKVYGQILEWKRKWKAGANK